MKLYVIVRKDLSISQRAVQAGHAIAEYLLDNSDTDWRNGTLVMLTVECERQLKSLLRKLRLSGKCVSEFREPDRNNELTSIASLGTHRLFKNLSLL